jgi:hypothetical protein
MARKGMVTPLLETWGKFWARYKSAFFSSREIKTREPRNVTQFLPHRPGMAIRQVDKNGWLIRRVT